MRLNPWVISVSGFCFAAIGAGHLLRRFDGLGVLIVFTGLTVAASPLRHRLERGPAGSGQILWNGLVVAVFFTGLGVFCFFAGLDSLGSGRVGGDVVGVWLLGVSVAMVIALGWLSVGLRKSWRRWRGW